MKRILATAALVLALGTAQPARAVDVVSARFSLLSFDDDVDSKDFETRSHLGLRLRTQAPDSGLSAEAEVSLLVSMPTGAAIGLRDNASFVRLGWRPKGWSENEGLTLTALPWISTRLHLGYEFPATWGRSFAVSPGAEAPALELRLSRERWYAFAASRSVLALNDVTHESERLATWMAGAGYDALPALRLEAAALLENDGAISTTFATKDTRARTIGFSGRALFHVGEPIGPSVDYRLYRNDPAVFEDLFRPETYSGQFSASVSVEGSYVSQRLVGPGAQRVGPNTLSAKLVDQGSQVLAVQARAKTGFLRAHALGLYRSATFPTLATSLGFPPGKAFGHDAGKPDVLLSAGADYCFAGPRLTPGIVLRAFWPAELRFSVPLNPYSEPPDFASVERVVLKREEGLAILPLGKEREAILTAMATLRWDFGDLFSAIGELSWTRDPNRAVYGTEQIVPDSRVNLFGFAAMLQARF